MLDSIKKAISLVLLAAAALLVACARVGSPNGGEKDINPPVLVKASPLNETVNFTAKQIVLQFDEYIKLSNLKQQLIISPALDIEPEISIKKRSIIIDLKGELKENTTYNFNFGDAIVDVNEGNSYKNFTYVLSTGTYLDTMTIGGTVVDAYSFLPKADFSVMLYSDTTDSVPIKQKPYYFAKTDKDGTFQLKNIKLGKYKTLAIMDKNKNFLWEANEEIAYSDSLQFVDTLNNNLLFKAFSEVPKKLLLLSKRFENNNRITLAFNKPCELCRVESDDNIYAQVKSSNNDSLAIWLKQNISQDTLALYFYNGENISDTLIYNLKTKDKKQENKQLKLSLAQGLNQNAKQFIELNLSEPLRATDNYQVKVIRKDSSEFSSKLVLDSSKLTQVRLDFLSEFGEMYRIMIPDSFVGYYGAISKADTLITEHAKADYYGKLLLKIDNKLESDAILVLTGKKSNTLRQVNLEKGLHERVFELMPPDDYKVLVIVDANKNGKWDSGDYLKHNQPETVLHFKEAINIRSNWDLELSWELNNP